jgi:Ca2+-binding RTX toxin-like protein
MGHRKGIKLVAYLPISKTTLVDIGGQNDLGKVDFFGATKTHFGINQGYVGDDVTFDIFGSGFKYKGEFGIPSEVPTSGTVKKVEVSVGGSLALVVSKLNLPALDAIDLYLNDDPFAGFAKLLKGNDTLIGSDFDDPRLWGGNGNDLLWGKGGNDIVDGFKGNDINDGGIGNDYLIDTRGDDTFQFSTPLEISAILNLVYNYDTIKKFDKGDEIYLKTGVFLGIGDSLSKAEFHYGDTATTPDQRILFDGKVGYWDRDGSGGTYEAIPFFEVENGGGNFNYKSFVMGVMYDGY